MLLAAEGFLMNVDYLVLADAVAAAEGKHYIHGAGWDTIWAGSFPVSHPSMGVAVRLRVPWTDTNQPHAIALDLIDGDGQSILANPIQGDINVGRPPTIPPGQDQVLSLAFNLVGVRFERPADFVVVVRIDGVDQGRAPFHVAQSPKQPAA